jgi:cyclic-di-AMP phosphodiesterase PgpH
LRELSSRAPGTFHHSINMGSLAEAAATAIGANAILARVGAYYHDIGKISEPEYFVENQAGAQNVHETMQPTRSAEKIINHVTEGIRLAQEYRLPQRVIDFIPAHHGTTLVAYFYEKQRSLGGDAITPESFRYAGPKPSTKETAIVMLADTIEASARAVEEPTVENIEALIESVVNQRLQQGQLEQCDLTFRDLALVKRSFLGILSGIHHSRIKYPSEGEAEAARKAAERTRKMLNLPSTTDAIIQRMKRFDQH